MTRLVRVLAARRAARAADHARLIAFWEALGADMRAEKTGRTTPTKGTPA